MRKKIFIAISLLLILGIATAFVCNSVVARNAEGKCYDDISQIPHNKVGLLLGTSPWVKSGKRNVYYSNRISTTVALFNAGKIDYILVSGDNRRNDYNEPEMMKKALMAQGIPQERIVLDYAGFRTLDSVVRANKVFGQSTFTVISQKFHNERAIFLANHFGIEAIAMNARDASVYHGFKTLFREKLARVKLFVDLLVGKQPKFLGDQITIGE